MSDLIELAKRCEKAGPDEQRELLLRAWVAVVPPLDSPYGPFLNMVEVGAFESAALMLVPDDWTAWELHSHSARTRFSADLLRLGCDGGEHWARGRASTPALAIAAASLRARSAG